MVLSRLVPTKLKLVTTYITSCNTGARQRLRHQTICKEHVYTTYWLPRFSFRFRLRLISHKCQRFVITEYHIPDYRFYSQSGSVLISRVCLTHRYVSFLLL